MAAAQAAGGELTDGDSGVSDRCIGGWAGGRGFEDEGDRPGSEEVLAGGDGLEGPLRGRRSRATLGQCGVSQGDRMTTASGMSARAGR